MSNNLDISAGLPKILSYVFYKDISSHVMVDVSGNKVNRNTLTLVNGVWQNSNGRVYVTDLSGSDISNSDLSFKFTIADNNGIKNLVNVSNGTFKIANEFDMVNDLFNDSNSPKSRYLTSYLNNYYLNFPFTDINTDINLSTVGTSGDSNKISFSTEISNNSVILDLTNINSSNSSSFASDISVNCAVNLVYTQPVTSNNATNNLSAILYKFGINSITAPVLFENDTGKFLSFDVNALTSTAYLVITDDGASAVSQGSNVPTYNPILAVNNLVTGLLPSRFNVSAGKTTVKIPINVTSTRGLWSYNIKLVDGNIQSNASPVTLVVNPRYVQPIVTSPASIFSKDLSSSVINIKYNNSNYNLDISNSPLTAGGLKFGFRLIPQGDKTFVHSDISSFTLKDKNGNNLLGGTALTDISTNKLTQSLLNQKLEKVDLSGTGINQIKKSDVSSNFTFNYTGVNDLTLKTYKYNLALDWLDASGNNISTLTYPININAKYNSTVNVTNLLNGTFSLSYEQSPIVVPIWFRVSYYGPSYGFLSSTDTSLNINRLGNNLFTNFTPVLSSNSYFNVQVLDVSENSINVSPTLTPVASTVSDYIALGQSVKPNVLLSILPNTFSGIDVNEIAQLDDTINLDDSLTDVSGYFVSDFNQFIDLTASISWPSWYNSIVNPNLNFTITDYNNIIKCYDICGNVTNTRNQSFGINGAVLKSVNVSNIKDLCNNLFIDLSFNSSFTSSIFKLEYTLSGDVGNTLNIPFDKNTIWFYVPESASALTSLNPGGNKNTIFIHNQTKLILDSTNSSFMALSTDCNFSNVFRNLGTTANNQYNLGLIRPEFFPSNDSNHIFDISNISMTATSFSTNSELPKMFFSFSKYANKVNSSSRCFGMNSGFSNLAYSFIAINNFVGYIDISYNTISNQTISTTRQTLRINVLPRPTLNIVVSDPSYNLYPNGKTNINYSVENVQMFKNNELNITSGSKWSGLYNADVSAGYTDLSFNACMNTRSIGYIKLTNGALSISPDANLFTLLPIGDLPYGSPFKIGGFFKFNGKNTTTSQILKETLTVKYSGNSISANNLTKNSNIFSIVIIVNSLPTITNDLYSNSGYFNNSIQLNNITIAKYVQIDPSLNTLNIDLACYSRTIYLIVENTRNINSYVTSSSTISASLSSGIYTLTIPGYTRQVFQRTGTNVWSAVFTI